MLSEADASLDLCLKQWAEETTGELRSVLLSAATRICALASENERLRRERDEALGKAAGFKEKLESANRVGRAAGALLQEQMQESATAESREAALRAENERLRKALLRLQTGAAIALDALPDGQQEGAVGNFLAAIHRECCAGLSAGQGADECEDSTP